MTGPSGTPPGPRPRPGRRALFSGPYDPGLATGEGDAPGATVGPETPSAPDRPSVAGRAEPIRNPGGEHPAGRRAFFSDAGASPGPAAGEIHPGLTTVVVECRTCRNRTPMSIVGLGLSLLPSLWLPTRPWPRLMRCPACQKVSWCRIEWPRLRG